MSSMRWEAHAANHGSSSPSSTVVAVQPDDELLAGANPQRLAVARKASSVSATNAVACSSMALRVVGSGTSSENGMTQ